MRVSGIARGLGEAGAIDACVAGVRGLARWLGLAAAMALLATPPAGAAIGRDPEPAIRIPLTSMGYQTLSSDFLLSGSSMLTVDFVDKDHLLITFGVRRLMKREADHPVDDDDRTIGAFLVELPSGKVLARTEWRVHDRSQYLWSLGHGRFLLRVRDRLTMFAPTDSVDPNEAFHEVPLLKVDRHIVAVLVSSDGDLLTVETTKWAMGSGEASQGFSADPAPVQINFYRLASSDSTADRFRAVSAGTIRTRTAVSLPMTTAGRLDVLEGGKDRWLFNFNEHAGKVDELSPFDTSCFPRPTFVGHSEFVAFGCRGDQAKLDFAGFNLKGEEMWQQNFYDAHVNPTFAFAPEAGRFALGRTIVNGVFDPELPLPAAVVSAQEVRVYQSYDGKQLFRIECTPVERAGQNFALSPDGLQLAVVRETTVRHAATKDAGSYTQLEAAAEVYTLPALTPQDRAAVQEAQRLAPADTGARIDLALERGSGASAKSGAAAASGSSAKVALGSDSSAAASDAGPQGSESGAAAVTGAEVEAGGGGAATGNQGDPQPAAPRKPPTLYGPDENPRKPQ
jgi:hypothetical protein